MRASLAGLVCVAVACRSDGLLSKQEPGNTAGADSGSALGHGGGTGGGQADSGGADSGAPGDTGTQPQPSDAPSWCLDWESGLLDDAGYSGDFVELWDGALVLVAAEGDTYSALRGEEDLDYRDEHALVLRSSHDGRVDSTAIATTALFDVEPTDDGTAHLWWWQLSEVDGSGIDLYADLIDESGAIVASLDLPVETGGFVPELLPSYDPIDGFPAITTSSYTQGALVQQVTDLTPWVGQRIKLRLYQHTRVENNGFFTVFDDLCLGTAGAGADLAWGPPDPTH